MADLLIGKSEQPDFRIDVKRDGDGWVATVYDFNDHGPDVPYAITSGGNLLGTLGDAVHYVYVAS